MSDITADQLKKDEAEREANYRAELSQRKPALDYGEPNRPDDGTRPEPGPEPVPSPAPREDKIDTLFAIADHMIAALRHLGEALPQHSYLRLLADQMDERLKPHRAPLEQPAPVVAAPPPLSAPPVTPPPGTLVQQPIVTTPPVVPGQPPAVVPAPAPQVKPNG